MLTLGGSKLAPHRPVAARGGEAPSAPPRLLSWVSGAVVLGGATMLVVGALRTGISWDEPYHVMRLRNYFEHGWFAVDWSVADGGVTDGESNTLVYGPVAMLMLHALAVLVGVEEWQSVAVSPEAYAVRHLGVVLIGVVGTAAAAALTRVVLGSWRWGLVCAAALVALPMWTGHAMFNIKDVPVATGYTLLTLALVTMVRPAHGHPVARVACLVAGTVLMVGTRPGMAAAACCGAGVLLAGVALRRTRTPGEARPVAVELLVGLGLAAAALVAIYPAVYAHPLRVLASAGRSAEFRDGDVGRAYVPLHLLAQFPLLLQAAFVIGLVWAVRLVLRRDRTDADRAVRVALVVAQVAVMPAAAVVTGAELYNGLRQLLFMSPAWAVVATLGLAQVLAWSESGGLSWRPRAAVAGCVLALTAPTLSQVTLFPYQYTYWNPTVDAAGIHVPSDYWRTSVPELAPDIPIDGQVVCSPTRYSTDGDPAGSPGSEGVPATELLAGRFSVDSSVDCRLDPLGPLAPRWAAESRRYDDSLPHDTFYVVIDRDHDLPRNCDELASVDRRRNGREVSMTLLARCRLDPPVLDRLVVFSRPRNDIMSPARWAYATEGWVQRGSQTGIETTGTAAALSFEVPAGCDGCTLVLDADAPADLTASVNDRPAEVDVAPGVVTVPLDPESAGTWVDLARSSGAPLGLRIRSLRVVPIGTD